MNYRTVRDYVYREVGINLNTGPMCSVDEAVDKMRKALYETKGNCNTPLGLRLAIHKHATVDDIKRLGAYYNDDGEKVTPPICNRIIVDYNHRKDSSYQKSKKFLDKKRPKFEETVYGRWFKSKGMWKAVEEAGLAKYCPQDILTSGVLIQERKTLESLMFASKLSTKRLKEIAPTYTSALTEQINLYGAGDRAKSKRMLLKYELDSLNEAPEEILTHMEDICVKEASRWSLPKSFARALWAVFKSGTKEMYTMELGRMLIDAMQYMGIGLYARLDNVEPDYASGTTSVIGKGTTPLAKKVVAIVKSFNSMLRQGFGVDIVRDEIITQLNQFSQANCGLHWTFFARNDAPKEYKDVEPKKKSSAKASSTKSSSKEPHIEVINGIELRF